MKRLSLLLLIGFAASPPGLSQTSDVAAERARLAYERIEAEARSREQSASGDDARVPVPERRSRSPVDQPPARREPPATGDDALPAAGRRPPDRAAGIDSSGHDGAAVSAAPPVPSAAPATGAGGPRGAAADELSRALEQLRAAGELRDAGYLTQEEFARIKARILEQGF